MKLSVCIFTYNHEKYISETLDSVLSQKTDFDFEIIIGEDCSEDNTAKIVQQYQLKYPKKIKATFNPNNLGLMENNIQTILKCTGEYIALLDGDDYWINPSKLQNQVNFLEKHQKYMFCFHDGKILKQDKSWHEKTCCGKNHPKEIRFIDIICDVHIPTFGIVFRRNGISDYPPIWFSKLKAPDRPLFLLLASKGPGFFIDEPWGIYRKHPSGNWTSRNYQSRWLTHLQIYEEVNNHFNGKYELSFLKCKRRVTFVLAKQLIQHGRIKRAICFFRKYIRLYQLDNYSFSFIRNVIFFLLILIKKKLNDKNYFTAY